MNRFEKKKQQEYNIGSWTTQRNRELKAMKKEPKPTYKEGFVSKFIYNNKNEFVEEVHVKV